MEHTQLYTTENFRFSLFFDLPFDKQEDILFQLDYPSIKNLCRASVFSKHPGAILFVQKLINGRNFWKEKVKRDFPQLYIDSLKEITSSKNTVRFWRCEYERGLDTLSEKVIDVAATGDPIEIQRLKDMGVKMTYRNSEGYTALMAASFGGHLEIVKVLCRDEDVDLEVVDVYGYTALIEAAKGKNPDIIRFLLECGADPNASTHSGATALMWSSYLGCLNSVQLLLNYGADIEFKSKCGYTALMQASKWCRLDILETLLRNGAELDTQNNYSYTALILASRQGCVEIVRMLLEWGADRTINQHDPNNQTALQCASRWGHTEIVKMLEDENETNNS